MAKLLYKENLRPVYKFLGLEPPPAGADKTVKMHPTDIPWYDYIGRKDPATGEVTCPWRRGRGKVQSGGSSGVQMAGEEWVSVFILDAPRVHICVTPPPRP